MKRSVAEYLAAARRFEQLARLEPRHEPKQLMKGQAEICIKLALKRSKDVTAAVSQIPPPIDWAR